METINITKVTLTKYYMSKKVNFIDFDLFGHLHGEDFNPCIFNGIWNRVGNEWKEGDETRFIITNSFVDNHHYRMITLRPDGIEVGNSEPATLE